MENDEAMTYSVPEDKFLSRPFPEQILKLPEGIAATK
jgi:hypothetical protein